MTFFLDNHLPPIFVEILKAQGIDAIHLRERFPVGADDIEWISEAGRQGWIVITADHKIRQHRAERLALRRANINSKQLLTQVRWFAGKWEAVERQAAQAERGELYEVPLKGPIRKILKPL